MRHPLTTKTCQQVDYGQEPMKQNLTACANATIVVSDAKPAVVKEQPLVTGWKV